MWGKKAIREYILQLLLTLSSNYSNKPVLDTYVNNRSHVSQFHEKATEAPAEKNRVRSSPFLLPLALFLLSAQRSTVLPGHLPHCRHLQGHNMSLISKLI